jgi:hypothetical protein
MILVQDYSAKPITDQKQIFNSGDPSARIAGTSLVAEELLSRVPDDRTGRWSYDALACTVTTLASAWAYSDGQTVSNAMLRKGFGQNLVHQISVANDAMFVQAHAYFIRSQCGRLGILGFRGTEPRNIINWLTDASVRVRGFKGLGHIHGGFYRNVESIWDDIVQAIEDALAGRPAHSPDGNGGVRDLPPLEALYITGHSLGAAMAVVTAGEIFADSAYSHWKKRIRGIYTYGQPMVGDASFASSAQTLFGDLLFRHVYAHDLIPRLPPATTGQFRHFGQEYIGSPEGWFPRDRAVSQVSTALLSVPVGATAWIAAQLPMLHWLRLPMSLDDHSPTSYLEASRAARTL